MVRLTGPFSRIGVSKVLVAGDLILDTYTVGKARRISPEAPVAVLNVQSEEHRPGGAGNVILNLISLGSEVIALGRVGADEAAGQLKGFLENEGASVYGILAQTGYKTPVKNRIIADGQQIVRVDHEQIMPLSEEMEAKILAVLPKLLDDVQIVALSDYGKGFLSKNVLRAIIDQAQERNIPIVADPKGIDFTKYEGATIIKPNLGEAYAAANLTLDASLEDVAARIFETVKAEYVMITRSEAGISVFHKIQGRRDFPVSVREIKDVTGAGDTVLAMLASAIASGLVMDEAVQLCNVAAGIAIERFGCARVTLSDLARRLFENDDENKIFDEEHLFALQEALRGCKTILLGISGDKGLTGPIFKSIKKLAHRKDWELLVYVRDLNPDEAFIEMLSSMHDVSFIILNAHSLRSLCNLIEPDEVYVLQDSELKLLEHSMYLV